MREYKIGRTRDQKENFSVQKLMRTYRVAGIIFLPKLPVKYIIIH